MGRTQIRPEEKLQKRYKPGYVGLISKEGNPVCHLS